MTGILDHPPLVLLEVNEHDPEALGKPLSPLEVVQKAPEMISPDRNTVFDGPVQFLEMASQIGNAAIGVRAGVV